MRTWHKSIPMKMQHEKFGVYNGAWSQQMDRYWESDDGYTVSSRQIRTAIGVVEHVTIQKVGPGVRGVSRQEEPGGRLGHLSSLDLAQRL